MTKCVDPTKAQFSDFVKLPDDGPVWMLNLIRLRNKAKYEDERGATGAEAYAEYARSSEPFFRRAGGKIVWAGKPEAVVIGPEDERWDMAFIAEYPGAAAFAAMVKDPGYQAIVHHRQAAVKTSRLIRMKPGSPGKLFG